jgi:hypothetical protein
MKEAQYNKSVNGTTTRFAVTPAAKPGLGCAGVVLFGLSGFLAGMIVGSILGNTVGTLVGIGVLVYGMIKVDLRPKLHKQPASFEVSPDAIVAQGKRFARDDIHRLAVRNHYDRSQDIVITGQTMPTGVAAGADIKHALRQVTYLLQLESGGRAHVLAAGMDETTAFGLLTDVRRILGFELS